MANFGKGAQVRQVVPAPIQGEIVDFSVDRETGAVQYLVQWQEGEQTRSRYFTAAEIEAVPDQPSA